MQPDLNGILTSEAWLIELPLPGDLDEATPYRATDLPANTDLRNEGLPPPGPDGKLQAYAPVVIPRHLRHVGALRCREIAKATGERCKLSSYPGYIFCLDHLFPKVLHQKKYCPYVFPPGHPLAGQSCPNFAVVGKPYCPDHGGGHGVRIESGLALHRGQIGPGGRPAYINYISPELRNDIGAFLESDEADIDTVEPEVRASMEALAGLFRQPLPCPGTIEYRDANGDSVRARCPHRWEPMDTPVGQARIIDAAAVVSRIKAQRQKMQAKLGMLTREQHRVAMEDFANLCLRAVDDPATRKRIMDLLEENMKRTP